MALMAACLETNLPTMVSNDPRPDRCGAPVEDGYCEQYPTTEASEKPVDGYCISHGPNAIRGGPPDDSKNAEGNSGGPGGPPGNAKAMRTGQYMTTRRQLEAIQREYEGKGYVRLYVEQFKQYKAQGLGIDLAASYAGDYVMAKIMQEELFNEGLETLRYTQEGGSYRGLDEPRMNQMMKIQRELRMGTTDSEAGDLAAAEADGDIAILSGEVELEDSG